MTDTTQPDGDGNGNRLHLIAENSIAKIIARYIMPAVMALSGFLITQKLTDLHDDNKAVWSQLSDIKKNQSEFRIDVTRLTSDFISHQREDNTFAEGVTRTLNDHEARIRSREQAGTGR